MTNHERITWYEVARIGEKVTRARQELKKRNTRKAFIALREAEREYAAISLVYETTNEV